MADIDRQKLHYRRPFVRGFTLVELLVAASILAIGIVGVLRSFLSSVSGLESVRNRFQALQFLQRQTEQCELASTTLEAKDEPVDLKGRKGIFKTEVSPFGEETAGAGLKQVTLSVAWQESGGIKDETIVFLVPGKK